MVFTYPSTILITVHCTDIMALETLHKLCQKYSNTLNWVIILTVNIFYLEKY